MRSAEGAALLSQQVTREANVLAYNDIFLLIGILACITVVWVGGRLLRIRLSGVNPMAEPLKAIARQRAQS